MSALSKAELALALHEQIGFSKREAKTFVDQFFECIRGALEQGETVKLSGFGGLFLRDKDARPGRNPRTGEEVTISSRRVVVFRAGQKLKARVEAYAGEEPQED